MRCTGLPSKGYCKLFMVFRAFQSWVCFSFASLCLGSFCGPVPAFADTLEDLLQEVKIPTLPSRTRDALDFLVAQKGFGQTPAHEVIQQLQNRQALNCVVVGGPIQIPIICCGLRQTLNNSSLKIVTGPTMGRPNNCFYLSYLLYNSGFSSKSSR